jgi:hypothetical protein
MMLDNFFVYLKNENTKNKYTRRLRDRQGTKHI